MEQSSNYKIASFPYLTNPISDDSGNLSFTHDFVLRLRDKPIFIHKLYVDFFYSFPTLAPPGTNPDAISFRHSATNWAFTASYNRFNLEHAPKPLDAQNLTEGTFGVRVIPLEGRIVDAWLNTGEMYFGYHVSLINLMSVFSYNVTIVLNMIYMD